MKSTGIVRRVDKLGRIVIPMELRKVLNISNRDAIEIFSQDNTLILRKYEPSCIFCGEMGELIVYKEKKVCRNCANKINVLFE